MRVDLKTDELHFIKQAIEEVMIKGRDAQLVSKLLAKIDNAFSKAVEKESS